MEITKQKFIPDTNVATTIIKSELEAQMQIAREYPRSIGRFQKRLNDMVSINEAVALECLYSLPRGGKRIEGPSIRMAEIIQNAWTNCQSGARVIAEEEKFVIAQGVFRDLEANTVVTMEVRRRITDKNGSRFNDDMITVTANAAASIARRNAILGAIPRAYWNTAYDRARLVAIGDVTTLSESRDKMIASFALWNVTYEQIIDVLGRESIADINGDDLLTLRTVYQQIKNKENTIDEIFAPVPDALAARRSNRSAKDLIAEEAGTAVGASSEPANERVDETTGEVSEEPAQPVEPEPAPKDEPTIEVVEVDETEPIIVQGKPSEALAMIGVVGEKSAIEIAKTLLALKSIKNIDSIANGLQKKFSEQLQTILEFCGSVRVAQDFLNFAVPNYDKLNTTELLGNALDDYEAKIGLPE